MKNINWPDYGLSGIAFGKHDSSSEARCLLLIHGWIDNAGSFKKLMTHLSNSGFYGYAIDLPGHGLSDRSSHHTYHVSDVLWQMKQWVEGLDQNVTLIGHSLGAGLATLLASTRLQQIKSMVLIDAIGLLTEAPQNAAKRIRRALNKKEPTRSYYQSIADAVSKRQEKNHLDESTAQALAERGLSRNEQGYFWSHDRAWLRPSAYYYTEESMRNIISVISIPTLVIAGKGQGSLMGEGNPMRERLKYLQHAQCVDIEGGHYPHAFEAAKTERAIQKFLCDYS